MCIIYASESTGIVHTVSYMAIGGSKAKSFAELCGSAGCY